jgi:hypothetical protein
LRSHAADAALAALVTLIHSISTRQDYTFTVTAISISIRPEDGCQIIKTQKQRNHQHQVFNVNRRECSNAEDDGKQRLTKSQEYNIVKSGRTEDTDDPTLELPLADCSVSQLGKRIELAYTTRYSTEYNFYG